MTGSALSGILVKDMIVGKKNAWVKAYNPQLRLPISKTTLSSVAEEAEHTLEVFYFHWSLYYHYTFIKENSPFLCELKSWQRVLQLVSIAGVGEQLLLAWNTFAS